MNKCMGSIFFISNLCTLCECFGVMHYTVLVGGPLHVHSPLELPVNGPMVEISMPIYIWQTARRKALPFDV